VGVDESVCALLRLAGRLFIVVDMMSSANVHKIPAGGWFPLLVGLVALTLMLVWRKGRRVAFERRDENAIGLTTSIAGLDQPGAPERMKRPAVYLTKETHIVPAALESIREHHAGLHSFLNMRRIEARRRKARAF
jgi:KUP system potassium uptake protein